jgi:hypothetical protein
MGNAGLIRDHRYRDDPNAGMPMPECAAGLTQLTIGQNASAELTLFQALRHEFNYSSPGLLVFLIACLLNSKNLHGAPSQE